MASPVLSQRAKEQADWPAEIVGELRAELAEDERVYWLGRPVGRWFCPEAISGVFFAIPWTAFFVFVIYLLLVVARQKPLVNAG